MRLVTEGRGSEDQAIVSLSSNGVCVCYSPPVYVVLEGGGAT